MLLSDVNFHDIQGLVRFGHGHLKEARYHLLAIKDAAAAKKWLTETEVSTAIKRTPPDTALQVAFTYAGLTALGLPEDLICQFSHEFRTGMYETHRARRLGDVGANHPDKWAWGQPDVMPHILVMVFAREGQLAAADKQIKNTAWRKAFADLIKPLDTKERNGTEHFGFVDGTSQPKVDWEREKSLKRAKMAMYDNVSALGEFLLGYPNEYGRYTDRPLVDASEYPVDTLPLAEDKPGKLDLGRNGTYLVFRDLAQDVPAFTRYTSEQANNDESERRKLMSAIAGRVPDGQPVIPDGYEIVPNDDPGKTLPEGSTITPLQNLPMPGVGPDMKDIWLNQFNYGGDPDGTACPHGAHIRRANPRTGDLPAGRRNIFSRILRMFGFGVEHSRADLVASTRFHRILRRGRTYGPDFQESELSGRRKKPVDRGLRFVCLNANISRQFEFIQATWLENPKFDGLDSGDPLLGSRTKLATGARTDSYTIPRDSGLSDRLNSLPQFVTVRGGAYFFLPGIRALRFIATR